MSREAIRRAAARASDSCKSYLSCEWSYQSAALNLARALTLASIVYAAWRYGATDPLAYCHLSLSLGAALILTLTCRQTYAASANRLPITFLTLILLWIGYAIVQQTTIATWLPAASQQTVDLRQQFGHDRIELLSEAVDRMGVAVNLPSERHYATVIPEETRQALIPFLLAFAVAVLSALLFRTCRSRLVFLWTIVVNASALAFWGIIQKAGSGQQILPGVENTFSTGMPFASFVYKNAGAAALMPALAAVGILLYVQGSRRFRRQSDSTRIGQTHAFRQWLQPKTLLLLGLGILITVGFIASLSRGAWFAALTAVIVVGWIGRHSIRRRDTLVLVTVSTVAMLVVVLISGIGRDITTRAQHVSVERVAGDQRWEQWADGLSTSMLHLPVGCGLGTYGFATLPNQSSPRGSWFREAHNQYLEVLTESGLFGLAVVFAGMAWLAFASCRLIALPHDREIRGWGFIGIALLVCGGVQSIFDFVLAIPANMMLYASLIAVIGVVQFKHTEGPSDSAAVDHTGYRSITNRLSDWMCRTQLSPPWCVTALLSLIAAYYIAIPQYHGEQALAATSVERFDTMPSEATVIASIAALDAAIEEHPDWSPLYARRANWHFAAYRLEVLRAAESQGIALSWADTQLDALFQLLAQQSASRNELLKELQRTPPMRFALAKGLADIAFALSCNPLSPRSHLTGALVAPLTGMPVRPWLESAAPLLNNSVTMLYANGRLAVQAGEVDIAVDQWKKSLAINHKHLDEIMSLGIRQIPAIRVATELVPPNRMSYHVRIIQSTARLSSDSSKLTYDRALAESIIDHLQRKSQLPDANRHATIAQIHHLFGRYDAAVMSWQSALQADARNPGYRLEYSRALSQLGRNDEALRQAVLGQTLSPVDRRFDRLTSQIRRQLQRDRGF